MSARGAVAANASAFAAAALFGASVVATRIAVQDIPPLSLAVLRFGQGSLVLWLSLFLTVPDRLHVERRDLPLLGLLGAILFAAFPLTFNAGLRFTEAARGALMLATAPLWSAWLARMARRERLGRRQGTGIVLTIAGVALVLAERGFAWGASGAAFLGDALMLATALLGAVYNVLAKPALDRYTAMAVTTYTMTIGTVLLFPAALAEGLGRVLPRLDGRLVALLLFLGIIGGALAYFLWTFALTRLSPTQVMVYVNLNPIVAASLGTALLGERLTASLAVGFATVLTGVLLVNWPVRPPAAEANHVLG